MNLLLALSTALAFVAVVFTVLMVKHLRRGRLLRATGSFAVGATTAALAIAGTLLLGSLYSYARLVDEQSIGLIEFKQNGPSDFTARLMIDGDIDRLLPLLGDEWQMDARVVSWKAPATVLGLDPVYQLERLSGRYSDIDREISEPRTVHALAEEHILDVWRVARSFPILLPGVDAYYGTATYLPMADGARFEVSLSRDALIARPVNHSARTAIGNWQTHVSP